MSNEMETRTVTESNPQVRSIVEERNAIAYLREKDCSMLAQLQGYLKENIRLHGILNDIQAEIARLKKLLRTPAPKIKKLPLIGGIIFMLIGIILVVQGNDHGSGSAVSTLSYAMLAVGVILIIVAIVLKVNAVKKWKLFIEETQAKLKQAEHEAEIAQQHINEHWENFVAPFVNEIVPARFPEAYVYNYNAVSDMLWYMTVMRADTIKEAINLYEECLHRRRVENALNSTARSAARTAVAQEKAAYAAEVSAASTAAMAASMASMAHSAERQAAASESVAREISG